MSEETVTLQIEELVLHGFAPGDRYRIADAVEREMGRLLAERGVPVEWASTGSPVDSLNADSFEIVAGARPERIGTQIAEAIYGSFDAGSGE